MKRFFKKYKPHWKIVLSAALYVFAFPHWDYSFLAWFCLIPWLSHFQNQNKLSEVFIQSIWLSMLITFGGFYWVTYSISQYGNLPVSISLIGLVLFGFICQPTIITYSFIRFIAQKKFLDNKKNKPAFLLCVLLGLSFFYTGFDVSIHKLFKDTLGHAFYKNELLRQVADIGGAGILTFICVFFNEALFLLIDKLKKRTEPSIWPSVKESLPSFGLSVLLIALTLTYGFFRNDFIKNKIKKPIKTVYAGVIQANIGDFDKVASETGSWHAADKILSTYIELSNKSIMTNPQPDFIVWPETAYPTIFGHPDTNRELKRDARIKNFVKKRNIPLLFGGYDTNGKKDFNSLFVLHPSPTANEKNIKKLQIYHKNVLLPFGEYIPGFGEDSIFKSIFPQMGFFGQGPGPEVYSVFTANKSFKVSPIICYEALFPNYIIGGANKGSEIILNITNDSWFGQYGEPYLHFALTVFRSIESRLPQIRSTNTGITALILPSGEIKNKTGVFKKTTVNMSIPITSDIPTLMKSWGDWFGKTSLLLGLAFLTFVFTSRKRQTHKYLKRR